MTKTYFTGKPCKLGHTARRYVSTRTCVECADVRAREWQAKNKRRYLDSQGESRRVRLFGIPKHRYDEILLEQGGGCAICGGSNWKGKRRFSIDHDHSCCAGERTCGKCVRGLLCDQCNHGIGKFGDNPERLRKAADYIEKWLATITKTIRSPRRGCGN